MTKIGMRTIKTGIGVSLCSLLSPYLIQNPNISAIACLISMQDTVSGSLQTGVNRIKGTIFGGIIGFLFLLLFPGKTLLSGIGIIITIYLCNIFRLNKSISIACVTFLAVQMGFTESTSAIWYAFYRILDTSIGVIIAVLVNLLLARPDYLSELYLRFKKIEDGIDSFLQYKVLDKEYVFNIDEFISCISEMEEFYAKFLCEVGYQKGNCNTNKVEYIVNLCREVNFHINSIELLRKNVYLDKNTYEKLKSLYSEEDIAFELKENKSPVFNYHLVKVIEISNLIDKENYKFDKKDDNKKKFFNIHINKRDC